MDDKDIRWKQRFQNFEKAILYLQDAVNKKELSDLEKAGVIQIYEFTFELAWKTVKDYLEEKNVEVKFPLLEDITMEVAKKYGMIQPGESSTKAVRAVFFIDPAAKIRAIIYYPLSLGRNFEELKRVLIGLQTADKFSIATPADWKPGEDVIVPPAGSCGVAEERMSGKENGGLYCKDWFFCMKPLPKEKVMAS